MDNIDVTNLNRQFLFREKDVGQPKATVAAAFINNRCAHLNVKVIPHVCRIQDFDESFFMQFSLIISGLDNIEARRWINQLLHAAVKRDADGNVDPNTVRALLDGGTEGLKGQSRLIIPSMTSCFECSLGTFPPQQNFPLCTIAETPRIPEHCVAHSLIIQWPKVFPDRKPDNDSVEDMTWVYERARERAEHFGISGVTYQLTLGYAKRIIPAVASTNALVASTLVTEAMKLLSYAGPPLTTYCMYMGNHAIYTNTFEFAKNPNCLVCDVQTITLIRDSQETLAEFLAFLENDNSLRMSKSSLSFGNKIVFSQGKYTRQAHEYKLSKTLKELVGLGELALDPVELCVSSSNLAVPINVKLKLTKDAPV